MKYISIRIPIRKLATAAIVAAGLTAAGAAWLLDGQPLRAQSDNSLSATYRQLDLFGDVFERVRADYVEEVSDQELIEAAINGMLTNLDPHSSYLDPESFGDMQVQTRGEFGGLGIEVTMENGYVKVVSPIDDTPAFRAGVQAGDYITHLDGEQVLGLTLADAVDRMRGKVDTDIELTIRREGEEPFDVTITRDIIKIQSVRYRAEGDIGYLRVTAFNEQTESGLKRAIASLKEEIGDKMIGLVIDLRNNPGGLLDQAIAVSDTFLDKGEIVSTRGREIEESKRFNAHPGDLADEMPIVVLINGGSASASEIVAGALQDHRRAIVLGTRSFGKGSVQTIIPFAGHGAVRLTTAQYFTPSGRSIQQKGIEPDILVEQANIETIADVRGRREENLRNSLNNPADGGAPEDVDSSDDATGDENPTAINEPAGEDANNDDRPVDYQLSRALDLLHGLSLYRDRIVN